jgi:hypothetical protein
MSATLPLAGAPALSLYLYAGGNAWTLDDPTLSRLNAGNVLGPTASGWVEVTCDVVRCSWRIGATEPAGPTSRFSPGFARVELRDPDRVWDPSNPHGPYAYRVAVDSQLRLVASYDDGATELGQWTMRLDKGGWSDGITTLECVDALADLAAYDQGETTPVGLGDTFGQRIERLATLASLRAPVDVEPGETTLQSTNLAQSALTLAYLAADAELGPLWVDQLGTLRGLSRDAWRTRTSPVEAIGPAQACGVLTASATTADRANVRNDVHAAGPDLTQESRADPDSIARFGHRRWGRNDLPLQTQEQLRDWVDLVLPWYTDARAGALEGLVLAPALCPALCRWCSPPRCSPPSG